MKMTHNSTSNNCNSHKISTKSSFKQVNEILIKSILTSRSSKRQKQKQQQQQQQINNNKSSHNNNNNNNNHYYQNHNNNYYNNINSGQEDLLKLFRIQAELTREQLKKGQVKKDQVSHLRSKSRHLEKRNVTLTTKNHTLLSQNNCLEKQNEEKLRSEAEECGIIIDIDTPGSDQNLLQDHQNLKKKVKKSSSLKKNILNPKMTQSPIKSKSSIAYNGPNGSGHGGGVTSSTFKIKNKKSSNQHRHTHNHHNYNQNYNNNNNKYSSCNGHGNKRISSSSTNSNSNSTNKIHQTTHNSTSKIQQKYPEPPILSPIAPVSSIKIISDDILQNKLFKSWSDEFGEEMEKAEIEETPSLLPKKFGRFSTLTSTTSSVKNQNHVKNVKSEPSKISNHVASTSTSTFPTTSTSTLTNNLHSKSKNTNNKSYSSSSTDKLINSNNYQTIDTKSYQNRTKNKVNSSFLNNYSVSNSTISSTKSRRSQQGQDLSLSPRTKVKKLKSTRFLNESRVKRSINLNDYEDIVGNLLPTVHINQLNIKYPPPNLNIGGYTRSNQYGHGSDLSKNLSIKPNFVKSASRTRSRTNSAASTSSTSSSFNILNEPPIVDEVGYDEKFDKFEGKRRRLSTNSNTSNNSLNGSISTRNRDKNLSLSTTTSTTTTTTTTTITTSKDQEKDQDDDDKDLEELIIFDQEENICLTKEDYFIHDELEAVDGKKELTLTNLLDSDGNDQKIHVDVPYWREVELNPAAKKSSSGSGSSGEEELLDDDTFTKRHAKSEIMERRRKRWDSQRQREESYNERLKQRFAEREAHKLKIRQRANRKIGLISHDDPDDYSDDETKSLNPCPEDALFIRKALDFPIQLFGNPLPILDKEPFDTNINSYWKPSFLRKNKLEKMLKNRDSTKEKKKKKKKKSSTSTSASISEEKEKK